MLLYYIVPLYDFILVMYTLVGTKVGSKPMAPPVAPQAARAAEATIGFGSSSPAGNRAVSTTVPLDGLDELPRPEWTEQIKNGHVIV